MLRKSTTQRDVTLTTEKGHLLFSGVWSPVGDPVKGRPSVYLDQCHWSTLAKTVVRPGAVPEADRAAARRIMKLGSDGGIRLPVRSATMQETAALFGTGATRLASPLHLSAEVGSSATR